MTNSPTLRAVSESPPYPPYDQPNQFESPPRDLDEGDGSVLRLLWHAWDHKWLVAAIVLGALGIGVFNYFSTAPSYTAYATMQIEDNRPGLSGVLDLQSEGVVSSDSGSIAAEIAIMKSRSVMTEVAKKLRRDIRATPRYEPWIGQAVARSYRGSGVAKPWFGKSEYAWGGEKIEVQSLLLPDAWLGRSLLLVAEQEGEFRLLDGAGAELLRGRVGTRAQAELAGGEKIVLFVSRLKARPNTEFVLRKLPLHAAAAGLSAAFSATENPKFSGILRTSFISDSPDLAAESLNAIMDNFQRRNVERKGEEADKTLAFLEKQLPPLQSRMSAAEAAYNDFLRENGTIDISRESQQVLDSIVKIENELFGLQQERETLRERFKPAHPKIQSIDSTVSTLGKKLAQLEEQTETLPKIQQTALRLARDVEVNNTLYSRLVNAMQELRIAKAGTIGNARVIDYALPPDGRTAPNLKKAIITYAMIGLGIGLAIVFVLLKLRRGIEDPDEIEQTLGIPVFGSIPFSAVQAKLSKQVDKRQPGIKPLALLAPEDNAVESIRSLRTSLHFLLLEAGNTTLLMTGPTQGVGKSFVCVNLALVLGQAGKRVLLIDADMRKGHLHRVLGIDAGVGLSEFIAGNADRDQVLTQFEAWQIDFIGTGARPPNPSELLMHERLADLLRWGAENYDYVILDAPPILAVTDPAIIGRLAGASLLVARTETNSIAELEQSAKQMKQGGANVRGVILNGVLPNRGYRYGYRYGYGYGYGYRSQYRYADSKQSKR